MRPSGLFRGPDGISPNANGSFVDELPLSREFRGREFRESAGSVCPRTPCSRCSPVYRESAGATELLGTGWVTCAITGVCDQINVVKP